MAVQKYCHEMTVKIIDDVFVDDVLARAPPKINDFISDTKVYFDAFLTFL